MKFKVVDQLDKFGFRDAELSAFDIHDGSLRMVMGGAVSRYNNPCNERYQDWYIAEAYVRFEQVQIQQCYKEGMKYYDADNVLQKEIPDMPIGAEDYESIWKLLKDGTVFVLVEKEMEQERYCVEAAIDVETEDVSDTYWITFTYERVIIEWDRYANKVMES